MVAHAFTPSPWEARQEEFEASRPSSSTAGATQTNPISKNQNQEGAVPGGGVSLQFHCLLAGCLRQEGCLNQEEFGQHSETCLNGGNKGWGCGSVGECLPSKLEALGPDLTASTYNKNSPSSRAVQKHKGFGSCLWLPSPCSKPNYAYLKPSIASCCLTVYLQALSLTRASCLPGKSSGCSRYCMGGSPSTDETPGLQRMSQFTATMITTTMAVIGYRPP